MFESEQYEPQGRGGGIIAMQFLAQQVLAPIAVLFLAYPIFRSVEMVFLQRGGEEGIAVWVWRWIAIVLPVIAGFGIGFSVQTIWPPAYLTGRFVGILPSLVFLWDFAGAVSSFSFVGAVKNVLDDTGGLEMWIGAIFYGIGVQWAYKRNVARAAGLN